MLHYCTYCDYYARNHHTGAHNGTGFTGTYSEVLAHADTHPIGDPAGMVLPVDADIAAALGLTDWERGVVG